MEKAYLVLENGEVFEGLAIGAWPEQQREEAPAAIGELVFTTGMTGYLEATTASFRRTLKETVLHRAMWCAKSAISRPISAAKGSWMISFTIRGSRESAASIPGR